MTQVLSVPAFFVAPTVPSQARHCFVFGHHFEWHSHCPFTALFCQAVSLPRPGIRLLTTPTQALHYASNSHTIPRSADTTPHDFYLTQPFSESIKRARKVPNTMSIFSKPKILAQTGPYSSPRTQAAAKGKTGKEKPKSGLSSGLESGIETLQNNLAQAEAQEGRCVYGSVVGWILAANRRTGRC